MSNILQIALTSEGTTDNRFLKSIIQKTFENLVFECLTEIDVYEPVVLDKITGPFSEGAVNIAEKYHYFHVLCIHCDADSVNNENVLINKINPAILKIQSSENAICNNVVPVIPVQMTESWMLADSNIITQRIDRTLTPNDLNLPKINSIEKISNPKQTIIDAIKISRSKGRKRSNVIEISQLYSIVSKEITLDKLRQLPSFREFEENCKNALIKLGYAF